jgi:carbamoyltransferase
MNVLDNVILGINDTHDASAAIMQGGKVLCSIAEERIQRVKGAGGFPLGAIQACLDYCGMTRKDIDLVVFGGERAVPVNMLGTVATFTIEDWITVQEKMRRPKFYEDISVPISSVFPNYQPKSEVYYDRARVPFKESWELSVEERKEIGEYRLQFAADACGVSREQVHAIDHHTAHAYYAYYASRFRDETVTTLTLDAGGDGLFESTNVFDEKGNFKRLHASHDCLIGALYTYITLVLGMRQYEHEYKVMGLAPYAKEHTKQRAREHLLGLLELDGIEFKRSPKLKDYYFQLKELLKYERFDGIAGGAQDFCEYFLAKWVTNAIAATGSGKIAYGGGVALNVKANQELTKLNVLEKLFIPPGPGDESLPIGAAWALMDRLNPSGSHRAMIDPLDNAYLGTDVSDADVAAFAKHPIVKEQFEERPGDSVGHAVEALANHEIVGVCRDRMEFGPRALGNRSIIANASSRKSVQKINDAIKNRDFWMPFAPSVLAERIDDYIFDTGKADYSNMTVCADAKELAEHDIVAGLHAADSTVRLHGVDKTATPRYHDLLRRFEERTGLGGVLNTSLNIHGKPIVHKPVDIANEILVQPEVELNNLIIKDRFFKRRHNG